MTLILTIAIACTGTKLEPSVPDADVYADTIGDPVPWMSADLQESYERGRKMMMHSFTTEEGVGPTFNADSCASCHQSPVAGGSAPRYRDFFLVKRERWDGALESVGTNGSSPVRNLYATAPAYHIPEPEDTVLYARRNTPPGFGVGLFAFVENETILAGADPNDEDGDGISGRANFEQGEVGKFGYKSQAATLESFNRGAILNQMGITSDPLFYVFPELIEEEAAWRSLKPLSPLSWLAEARAQVSAPDEPTVDDDDVPDPEISNEDQLDLLIFSTYVAAPRPSEFGDTEHQGERAFAELGCADCHQPTLDSVVGPIRAYTDLLLHDMGEELADGIAVGFATGSEFRTQPLWGVALHGPYLHDGRASSLREAIELHGGEAAASRERWLQANADQQESVMAFLRALGGKESQSNFIQDSDVYPDPGSPGGPLLSLTVEQVELWNRGRVLFDVNVPPKDGLASHFNADSCRACHQDPVIGGAGGLDVNVIRYGYRDLDDGSYVSLPDKILERVSSWGYLPERIDQQANIIEMRNPPTVLGIGLIESISQASIVALADPEDEDGDGISGRPSWLPNGQLGRYGWKANIPTVSDFVADALFNEMGITVHGSLSPFTGEDTDSCPDPEVGDDDFTALSFFLMGLAAPSVDPEAANADSQGMSLFTETGCASCHIPEIDGVPLFSDLLLHDIAPDAFVLVEQDPGVSATEYRTPPLWGVLHTAPYLHDGSAPTLEAAIMGHAGEASSSTERFQQLSTDEKMKLITYLQSL